MQATGVVHQNSPSGKRSVQRMKVLGLQAATFAEERFLAKLSQVIASGGEVHIRVADGTDEVHPFYLDEQ